MPRVIKPNLKCPSQVPKFCFCHSRYKYDKHLRNYIINDAAMFSALFNKIFPKCEKQGWNKPYAKLKNQPELERACNLKALFENSGLWFQALPSLIILNTMNRLIDILSQLAIKALMFKTDDLNSGGRCFKSQWGCQLFFVVGQPPQAESMER